MESAMTNAGQTVEIIDPVFRSFVLPNAPLEMLAEGLRWLEGPVWFADHDFLLVSDLPDDRVMRWSETAGMSEYRRAGGFENGHARDRQGRLFICASHTLYAIYTNQRGAML